MYDKSKISEKVLKASKSIENENKIKVLQTWYENTKNFPSITDYEREYLLDEVEKKIRLKFPNKAKKILGGKSAKAQELLDEIFKLLTQEFDWSNNNVGNKVKVGGSMISGKEFVCWYISYKNDEGYSTGLHYRQLTPEDDPYLDVDYRRVGKDYENEREFKKFPIQLKEEAIDLFKEYLKKTIK